MFFIVGGLQAPANLPLGSSRVAAEFVVRWPKLEGLLLLKQRYKIILFCGSRDLEITSSKNDITIKTAVL